MARKRTPEVSTITRPSTVAYARKQKSSEGDDEAEAKAASETTRMPPAKDDDKADFAPERPTMTIDPKALKDLADAPARGRSETTAMPAGEFGAPPAMPEPSQAGLVIKGGAVEDPTHMPGPREIPPGNPEDVASPPGHVPPGDSRSLRRRAAQYEFALVYRVGNAVISRHGVVGTRGVWRVVEYPTTSSASNAYAREASRFVTDGFSDYRE